MSEVGPGFETLLRALEEYMEAKKEVDSASQFAPCSDWDCGIAAEFEAALAPESQKRHLENAKLALEAALNEYIDARLEAVMGKRTAGD